MARAIANANKQKFILQLCSIKRLSTPRIPIDEAIGMLKQVWTHLVLKSIVALIHSVACRLYFSINKTNIILLTGELLAYINMFFTVLNFANQIRFCTLWQTLSFNLTNLALHLLLQNVFKLQTMKKLFFAALVFSTISACAFAQTTGYKIEVNIEGLKDTTVMLGYHFGPKKFVADTASVDSKGYAVFTGDTLLNGGIYFIVLPEKQYFELLMDDDQEFGVHVNRDNLVESLTFTGCSENTAFADYQRFMIDMQAQNKELSDKVKAAGDNKELKEELKKQFDELNSKVEANWDRILAENKGTLLASMINAMKQVEIPTFDVPVTAAKPDSVRWAMGYNYNRNHYFDNIDLNDSRLIRTPILEQRVDNYFDRVLLPQPDSVINAAIKVIEMTKGNKLMFQYMLQHLTNKFQVSERMGMDGVFAVIAEKYYLSGEAWWADKNLCDRLKERVDRIKPNMIGKKAPDLWLPNQYMQYQRLSEVKSKITVLYFWDPDCGHCKKYTPELKKIYEKFKDKGMSVFAIFTQGDQPKWMEYTKNRQLNDWIHVWDPNIGSNFRNLYDISATPVVFVLDADKRIIAKRISPESLEQIIEIELGK